MGPCSTDQSKHFVSCFLIDQINSTNHVLLTCRAVCGRAVQSQWEPGCHPETPLRCQSRYDPPVYYYLLLLLLLVSSCVLMELCCLWFQMRRWTWPRGSGRTSTWPPELWRCTSGSCRSLSSPTPSSTTLSTPSVRPVATVSSCQSVSDWQTDVSQSVRCTNSPWGCCLTCFTTLCEFYLNSLRREAAKPLIWALILLSCPTGN